MSAQRAKHVPHSRFALEADRMSALPGQNGRELKLLARARPIRKGSLSNHFFAGEAAFTGGAAAFAAGDGLDAGAALGLLAG